MDDDLETIEEAFDLIPEEVQRYIYSDEFDQSMETLFSDIGINAEKQIIFKGMLFAFIAGIESRDAFNETIKQIALGNEQQQKIADWIDTNISQKIIDIITEAYLLESNRQDDESLTTEPAPIDTTELTPSGLAAIANRLEKTSIATVSNRDYSLNRDTSTASATDAAVSKPVHAIDPYHEAIDNE